MVLGPANPQVAQSASVPQGAVVRFRGHHTAGADVNNLLQQAEHGGVVPPTLLGLLQEIVDIGIRRLTGLNWFYNC